MPTRITLLGAAGDVTGSAYLLETSHSRVLIDFGMFQGGNKGESVNILPPEINPSRLDAIILTHAHLDHSGRLPLLTKNGYRGKILTVKPTVDLTSLILRDSAHIQAQDTKRSNRKRERAGEPLLEPSYTAEDVAKLLSKMHGISYKETITVTPDITVKFVDAGHILGSASLQLRLQGDDGQQTIVFSGDIGQNDIPIMNNPETLGKADLVFLESTYGDRNHRPLKETEAQFEDIVRNAVGKNGKILVPTFAVGRTQLMLYLLAEMFCDGTVSKFPIYIDSPMAIEATKIYREHIHYFDDEFQNLRRCRPPLEAMKSFIPTPTAQDSMALNHERGPCLIMAGSGMCSGGRILHHLKQNLWRSDAHVLIVGFQAYGSLGRMLVDGADSVKVFCEKIAVKATIHTLGGFSAHAGQSGLMEWLKPIAKSQPRVVLTHGESRGRDALAHLIDQTHGIVAEKPFLGDVIEL